VIDFLSRSCYDKIKQGNDMSYKPMTIKDYSQHIKKVGWTLEKGSIDWNLYNENNEFLCAIKITHGKGKKQEIDARSVKKTEREFKVRGWSWPPRKK